MKKEVLILAIFISMAVLLPLVAADVTISKIPIVNVVAKEATTPAIYNLTITNNEPSQDTFYIYTLLDMMMSPKESLIIPGKAIVNIQLEAYPGEQLRKKEGDFFLTYYIRGDNYGQIKDLIPVKIVSLYDAFQVSMPAKVTVNDSELILTLYNNQNLYIPEGRIVIDSPIFSAAKTLEIKPNSTNTIIINLTDKIRSYEAGEYSADISLLVHGQEAWKATEPVALESVIKITSSEKNKGWFLYPVLQVTKTNDGNALATTNIRVEKDPFSKLFTRSSVTPTSVRQIKGSFVYEWQKDLKPGESFVVEIKTNYLLPLIIFALVAAAAILLWMSTTKPVVMTKRVSKVKTKGGEFALKVNLFLKTFIDIKNVKIVDLAPMAMPNIPPKFGAIQPTRISGRRLEWSMDRLYKGEERIFSYIIYSKLPLIGEIDLPKALATYQDMLDRNKREYSNRIFFMAEEKRSE